MFNLKNATVLTRAQQKNVKGGGSICAYSNTMMGEVTCLPYGGAAGADFMAGKEGYWCCNCQEAYEACEEQL